MLQNILKSIMRSEGGKWDDPIGGFTNFGITQTTLDNVRSRIKVKLPQHVYDLDRATACVILEKEYIERLNLLALPPIASLFHSHMAVMSWDDGIKIMQERLGVKADGIIGPRTLAAVRAQTTLGLLYGTFSDVSEFCESRTNGFKESYINRFNAIEI